MGAGDNSKFIIEFQAELKKLKQGFAEMKSLSKQAQQDTKKTRSTEQKYEKTREKDQVRLRKQGEKDRKAERVHVQQMGKLHGNLHKQQISALQNMQRQSIKALQNVQKTAGRMGARGGAGAGGRGGQPGQGGSGRPGFFSGLGVGVAATGLLRGAWDLLTGGATSGYQKYMEYGQTMGRNIGLGSGKQIKQAVRGAGGGRLGYSMTDTAAMVPMMARATGQLSPRELMQAQRSTGMEAGEAADQFGMLRRAGFSFEGSGRGKQSAGANEFKKIIAAGMYSGLEKGRFPEFAQGVQQLAEQQRQLTTGTVDVAGIARQLAMWGASGKPGMQGQAGANLMGKVTGGIMSPGGGEWGEAFMRQAMGFGKPGGRTSFYDAEKRRESAGRDPSVVMDVMSEFKRQFGGFGGRGKEESALAMRESFGVTLNQAEELQKIYSSSKSVDDKQAEIKKVMDASKSIEQQSLDNMKDIGGAVKRIAELTNRGIGIGAKAAPFIEKIEDWQFQALQYLMDIAKNVADMASIVKETFGSRGKSEKTTGELLQKQAEPLSADPVVRHKQLAERRRLEQRAANQLGERSVFDTVLTAAKGVVGGGDATEAVIAKEKQRALLEASQRKSQADMRQSMKLEAADRIIKAKGATSETAGLLSTQLGMPLDEATRLIEQKRKRKKTDSGTVQPTAPAAAPSGTAPASDADGGPARVQVEVKQTGHDARDTPDITVQKAGGPRKQAAR